MKIPHIVLLPPAQQTHLFDQESYFGRQWKTGTTVCFFTAYHNDTSMCDWQAWRQNIIQGLDWWSYWYLFLVPLWYQYRADQPHLAQHVRCGTDEICYLVSLLQTSRCWRTLQGWTTFISSPTVVFDEWDLVPQTATHLWNCQRKKNLCSEGLYCFPKSTGSVSDNTSLMFTHDRWFTLKVQSAGRPLKNVHAWAIPCTNQLQGISIADSRASFSCFSCDLKKWQSSLFDF